MFMKMKGFTTGHPIVVNMDLALQMVPMKEHGGATITMVDGSKIMVRHNLEDIFYELGHQRHHGDDTYDLTFMDDGPREVMDTKEPLIEEDED